MVSAFQEETGADGALEALEGEDPHSRSAVHAAAVIRGDAVWSGGNSASPGALIAGGIGLLFPPGVLVTGPPGAAIGELGTRLSESGLPDPQFKGIGESLGPGTSAIITIVTQESISHLERQLADQGATTVHESVVRTWLPGSRNHNPPTPLFLRPPGPMRTKASRPRWGQVAEGISSTRRIER